MRSATTKGEKSLYETLCARRSAHAPPTMDCGTAWFACSGRFPPPLWLQPGRRAGSFDVRTSPENVPLQSALYVYWLCTSTFGRDSVVVVVA